MCSAPGLSSSTWPCLSVCWPRVAAARRAGDAAVAAARLREALALWRGPALADLALLEFVQPEVRRLEELRLLA